MKDEHLPKLQKFRVNYRWHKTERGSCEVYAYHGEQAQDIAKALFRESYTPDCRIQEFTTIEIIP